MKINSVVFSILTLYVFSTLTLADEDLENEAVKLLQAYLKVDTIRSKVGINSTVPTGDLQVGVAITVGSASGIISATAFYGDGSNLEGVSSAGLGTALSDDKAGSVIYYTDTTLGIGSTVNILVPSGSDVAYTQYAEIAPDENVDVIVSDSDDFVIDVLGLSTAGGAGLTGTLGGRIRAGYLVNRAADGAPQLTYGAEVPVGYGITGAGGINISGFATAGGFVGNLTGDVTGNASGTAGGLSGAPDVDLGNISAAGGDLTIRNITGVAATFTGTLTYEDVTNIDAVGFVTFQKGAIVQGAGSTTTTLNVSGVSTFVGFSTFKDGVDYGGGGTLREKVNIVANKISAVPDINLDNGMVHYFTTTETTTAQPNIISGVGINTELSIGETASITIITTAAAAAYSTRWKVDGLLTGITTSWVGGSEPSAGNSSGLDTYALTLIKTADATYTIINNLVNSA